MTAVRMVLLALVLPLAASAASLDFWLDAETTSDSLQPSSGRADIGLLLRSGDLRVTLLERYATADSTGLVPRFTGAYSRTDLLGSLRTGPVRIEPSMSYLTDLDRPEMVLPDRQGRAYRGGYARPGLELSAFLPAGVTLSADGYYWSRDAESEDGTDLDWTEYRLGGSASWRTPPGPVLSVSGRGHTTVIDGVGYESDWSMVDLGLSTGPARLPAMTTLEGSLTYSLRSGYDYLGRDLANRLTARFRGMKALDPRLSFNIMLESSFDFDGDVTRAACNAGEVRVLYRFDPTAEIPSNLALSGKFSSSAVQVRRVDMSSRVNLWEGLSLLLSARAMEIPSSTPGSGFYRRSVSYGPGLEYQLGTTARLWGVVEQERTETGGVQDWWRLRAGVEIYPAPLSL